MGPVFVRRLRSLLRLSMPTWSGFPVLCVIGIASINTCFGFFDYFVVLVNGNFNTDLTTVGIVPRDTEYLVILGFVPLIVIIGDFTLAYLGQMLALHIRRVATYEGHRNYFGRKVPYAMNCMPTKCVPGSVTHWQPDQRLQNDAVNLYVSLSGTLFGGAATKGFIGAIIELIIGLAFGLHLSPLMCLLVMSWVLFMGTLLYCVLPLISKGVLGVQKAEGEFRVAHALVREFTESIVFYGGQKEEARRCNDILDKRVAFERYWLCVRSILPTFVGTCMSTLNGGMVAVFLSLITFYLPSTPLQYQTYGAAVAYFGSTSIQVGWITTAWGNMGGLAGYTHRVCAFLEASKQASDWVEHSGGEAGTMGTIIASQQEVCATDLSVRTPQLLLPSGQMSDPVDVISKLSFDVRKSTRFSIESPDALVKTDTGLVIDGKNGTGKSSLMRVFAGLWAPAAGNVSRPPIMQGSLFVGQTAYATEGPLLEQVAYPLQSADRDLVRECLAKVGLEYLTENWGLDEPCAWATRLSGGEMQRLGLARVLYHRQRFAFLDESTSALNVGLEQQCLQAVQEAGITPISVSVRPTSHGFHNQKLLLSGAQGGGKWELKKTA